MNTYLTIFLCLISSLAISQSYENVEFINQPNNDSLLLVMISGYKGAEDWHEFKDLIIKDDSLVQYDLLTYGLNKDLNINDNAINVSNLIDDWYNQYYNYFFTSYSMGGIVTKQYFLNRFKHNDLQCSKIAYLVFVGTPNINENFTTSVFKKTLGFIFRPVINPLLKDAAKDERISNVNDSWLQLLDDNQENCLDNLNIFGRDDPLVVPEEIDFDSRGESIIISGNHRKLVEGVNIDHCSFRIIRRKLINKNANISLEPCINP